MQKPWRQVIHIGHRETKRGGTLWMLTLECGHALSKYAPNPKWRPEAFRGQVFAPKKMRCWICRAKEIRVS